MGVPTSEVGYTSAMPRREDHEVRKGHVRHWIKKKYLIEVMGLFLQNILWHWIVIYVEHNNYNNKQSHQYGIFRTVQAIFMVL